jgi:hypothetical protein
MAGRTPATPGGPARRAGPRRSVFLGAGILSGWRRVCPGRGVPALHLAFAAALLLSACASRTASPGPAGRADGQPSAIPITGNGGADRAAAGNAGSTAGGSGGEIAALPPELSSPDRLKGMKGREIVGLLGPPDLIRHDEPAEVWQYVAQGCVLDLFLYPPQGGLAPAARHPADNGDAKDPRAEADAGAEHRVIYYELRGRDGTLSAGANCFGALVATSRARRSG